MEEVDIFTDYYLRQIGSGYGGIYAGPSYQRGYGIGSFLGGLFRTISPLLPFVKSAGKAVGKEVFNSGIGFLKDIATEDIDTAYKKRGKQIINNLSARAANRMFGSGYKYKTLPLQTVYQSTRKRRQTKRRKSVKTKKLKQKKKVVKRKRVKRDLQDIFS